MLLRSLLLFLRLPLGPALLVLLEAEASVACFSRQYFTEHRDSLKHTFVEDEYEPRTPEYYFMASGPIRPSDIVTDPRKLPRVMNPDIEFGEENARRMTKRCREKVEALSILVQDVWPRGVYLKVLRAWTNFTKNIKEHAKSWNHLGPLSRLHHAGRAVDLTFSSQGRAGRLANHGRLAELASYEASFDWCIRKSNFVHCSVKPDTAVIHHSYGCLHGDSVVSTDNGTRLVRQLQLGDRLVSRGFDGSLISSPVIGFLHRDASRPLTFLVLRPAGNGSSLRVTPNHLVFRLAAGSANPEAVFASDLRPGDVLLRHVTKDAIESVPLLRIDVIEDVGAFAPITDSGTLFVDAFLVSAYAHIKSHRMAHLALWPLRMGYLLGLVNDQSTVTTTNYGRLLLWLGRRILPRGLLYET